MKKSFLLLMMCTFSTLVYAQRLPEIYQSDDRRLVTKASIIGYRDLSDYFDENLVFPVEAYLSGCFSPNIILTFIVDKDGEISEVERCDIWNCNLSEEIIEEEFLRVLDKFIMEGGHYTPACISKGNGDLENVRQYVQMEYKFDFNDYLKRQNRQLAHFETTIQGLPCIGLQGVSSWLFDKFKTKGANLVRLSAYVDKKGNLYDIKVIYSIDESLNGLAISYAKKMPKWIPEMVNGKPCDSVYPVVFEFWL